jgi:hypothetical protein
MQIIIVGQTARTLLLSGVVLASGGLPVANDETQREQHAGMIGLPSLVSRDTSILPATVQDSVDATQRYDDDGSYEYADARLASAGANWPRTTRWLATPRSAIRFRAVVGGR